MNKKNIIILILLLIVTITFTGCNSKKTSNKISIITTSFPCYDFARAVTKDIDDVEVTMLLKPGSETHDFEPTPQDIINIQKSKLFIYVGGESDEWIKDVLNDIDTSKTKIVKLVDIVELLDEEELEGVEVEEEEEEEEIDEHVWTSPKNAIKIVNYLKDEIVKIDSNNKKNYENNTKNYVSELEKIDSEIKEIVSTSKRKELIFGDRFPFLYFTKEYGLSYYAAFPGCSHQSEASAKTIAFLVDKVKTDSIPVVLHIELSGGKIANSIAEETGAKVLELNSAHNISQTDFDKGITYVDIMKNNIKVLKEALN
jgi:zinc transport system substrate-binding protein